MSPLILGANGQLGKHLAACLPEAVCIDRSVLDLAELGAIDCTMRSWEPSVIINAAAYTAVDRAESEPDLAWRVNAEAPAELARVASAIGVPLIHVSTDYVFDGRKRGAYEASDAVCPTSVYGRSKLAGELAVATLASDYWILRTSWVFSAHGHNFVRTMLRLARERTDIRVVDDQHGSPTYAGDLADIIRALVLTLHTQAELPSGLFHVSGGPATSWRGFAESIFAAAHAEGLISSIPTVAPIATADYPTPAVRPANSVLEHSRELDALPAARPDWQRGLAEVVERLRQVQAD